MTPPKKAVEEATEAEVQPEVVVEDNGLPAEVWEENAHIFDVSPEIVRAALSLIDEGPYNRDQVANGIATLMSRPVEQEG
jgi:hypothetical protein